ncbi:MAG: hypothetical protein IT518_17815 [Burkholderiales bacterium]|nr:hypothetical protein [Burkholderiales bacterium]
MSGLPPVARLPLLVLGFVSLAVGIGAGLARLGVGMPAVVADAASIHGPLMVGGFFGVVIALERAVAIGRTWAYAAPLLAGIGGIAAIAAALPAARLFMLAGSAVLVAASLDVLRRQPMLFTLTIAVGAACWMAGSLLWALGLPVYQAAAWWLAFLVLTIAGERLELSRFMPPSPVATRVFAGILAALVAALFGGAAAWAHALYPAGLVALAIWLVKQDIARRTVRGAGLTRYIAVCLLAGYAWLAAGGAIALFSGGFTPGTLAYDAAVHAVALGFVFSMVFGHAPIIVPAVVRAAVPYHATFYLPLALLHASVAVRLAGDAAASPGLRSAGGVLSAVALAAFIASTLTAVVRGKAQARLRSEGAPRT